MKFVAIFILSFCIMTCRAQVPNIKIQEEEGCFYVNEQLIKNFNYIIMNNEDTPIWIWFSKNDISSLTNYQKIKLHFRSFPSQGDSSYYQWMCDGNVASFIPSLFFGFGKVIQPNEHFCISFIYRDKDMSDIQLFIDTHLNIVLEKEIVKQCPGIDNDSIKEKFTFCPSMISIQWDEFIKDL